MKKILLYFLNFLNFFSFVMLQFKRPMNMMQNPSAPQIQKQGPRSYFTGKHWNVDAGMVLRDQEVNGKIVDGSVLLQNRSEEHKYGKSSYTPKVNKEFRPPLQFQEDLLPLSRLPRQNVIPNLNPISPWQVVENQKNASDTASFLTDKVKHGYSVECQKFQPLYVMQDSPESLGGLRENFVQTSAHAGYTPEVSNGGFQPDPEYQFSHKTTGRDIQSGMVCDVGMSDNSQIDVRKNIQANLPASSYQTTPTTVYTDSSNSHAPVNFRTKISPGVGITNQGFVPRHQMMMGQNNVHLRHSKKIAP